MDTRQCDHLDDYLAGCLSADDSARFEAHLADCPACGEEVAHQRRIDRLLARGAGGRDPAASSLVDRIERRIRSLRRRRVTRVALGLSAAVAAAVAVGVWLIPRDDAVAPGPHPPLGPRRVAEEPIESEPEGPIESDPEGHEAAPPTELASESERRVRVSLADPSEAILVRVPTSNPNVSIVWIYPSMKRARAAAEPAAVPP